MADLAEQTYLHLTSPTGLWQDTRLKIVQADGSEVFIDHLVDSCTLTLDNADGMSRLTCVFAGVHVDVLAKQQPVIPDAR